MDRPLGSPTYVPPRTKLRPPRAQSDTITRPRLVDTLCAAVLSHRLTLLSAPAGYGKTTLLAECAAVLSSELRVLSSELSQPDQLRTQNSELKTWGWSG
jgi:ATP/maltotriose-dependent transcriptional regulator MalT